MTTAAIAVRAESADGGGDDTWWLGAEAVDGGEPVGDVGDVHGDHSTVARAAVATAGTANHGHRLLTGGATASLDAAPNDQ